MSKGKSKVELFLDLAKPDEYGHSDPIPITKFVGKYAKLEMGNGGSWCRDDGTLGNAYNVERHKLKNKIVAIQLHGFKKNPIKKPIPNRIREQLTDKKCAILATGQIEIDHKDGRRDDARLSDSSKVTIDDFQPLSKSANNAKRQHCKVCRDTNKRFDAKQLGYKIGQVISNGTYRGDCTGCYWHDPILFNKLASKDFKK